jgi:hypothetical protein
MNARTFGTRLSPPALRRDLPPGIRLAAEVLPLHVVHYPVFGIDFSSCPRTDVAV